VKKRRGWRLALVVSNNLFNRINSLAMVCPITRTDKGHPFHIRLTGTIQTDGIVLCDQARMLDMNNRNASFIEKAPATLTAEAVDIITGFIEIR